MAKYILIQTYEAAVNLEVEADSEEEALAKAEQEIAGGRFSELEIIDSLEPGELYVQQ